MTASDTSRAFAASIGGVIATRVVTAVTSVLVARLLGPELRGVYGLLVFGAAVAGVVATWGMEVWIPRVLASRTQIEQTVQRIAVRRLRQATVGVVLVFALLVPWHPYFSRTQLLATALMVVATAWSMLRLAFLAARLRMRRFASAQVVGAFVYLGFTVGLWLTDLHSAALVMTGAAVSTIAIALVAGVALRPSASVPVGNIRLSIRGARALGRTAMVGELLALATYRADSVLIAWLLGERAVGLYLVAATVSEVLWLVPNGLAQALLPRVATDERPDVTRSVLTLTVASGLLGAVVLSLLAGPAIPWLFGRSFRGAAPAVPLLCLAAVMLGVWKLLVADLAGRGDTSIRAWTGVAALSSMLTIDLLLVPPWGLVGAASGALVGYGAAALLTTRRWLRATGVPPSDLLHIAEPVRVVAGLARRALR